VSHGSFLVALEANLLTCSDYYAPYVSESKDIQDFLRFCDIFVSELGIHHDLEENVIFPMWAEATGDAHIMDASVAEHKAFHDGLDQLQHYATTTKPAAYKSADLVSILDSFTPVLVQHLSAEVETILSMQKYDGDKLLKTFQDGVKAAMGDATKDEAFPFVFSCNDATFEGGKHYFPPVPWVVNFVIKWWFARKYQDVWRFSPSDMYGMPKPRELGPDAPAK
jgi:hemerythrin-like domain-containing protein